MFRVTAFALSAALLGLCHPAYAADSFFDSVKQAGRSIGHATRDITREIGHTTRDATKEIGKAFSSDDDGKKSDEKKEQNDGKK